MEIVRQIKETEMVAELLRAELTSDRWKTPVLDGIAQLGRTQSLVDSPDLTNAAENADRALILGNYRGYRQNKYLFATFPDDVRWCRVRLERGELQNLFYLNNCEDWLALSGGTRRVVDGASGVRNGKRVGAITNEQFRKTAIAFQHGERIAVPILVAKDLLSKIVVLDGHLRLTSLLLEADSIPDECEAVVGFSERFDDWYWY